MSSPAPAPLIITARLPAPVQAWADGLRRVHFPQERNHLAAHVTLFHALPPSADDEVRRSLAAAAGRNEPLPATISGVMALGGGTALAIVSEGMAMLRADLAERFAGLLTAQDQGRPRLHVTIQNKVTGAAAMALQTQLRATFSPRDFRFAGLELHRYRGGPWEFVQFWPFRG